MLRMLKLFISISLLGFAFADTKLNNYIRHFESLTYNQQNISESHRRISRSITKDPFLHINFQAHGRNFDLRLRPDPSVFSPNLQVDISSKKLTDFDISHIYKGHLWGEPDTYVFGSIRDGIFDGQIYTPTEVYYIERAQKYFKNHFNLGFHSIIYKDKDVIDVNADKRTGCGVTDEAIQKKQLSPLTTKAITKKMNSYSEASPDANSQESDNKYSNTMNSQDVLSKESLRKKRQTAKGLGNQKVCSLYIQTDTLLWNHIYSIESNDPYKTRSEIISMIHQHVAAVNFVFSNTAFGEFRDIQFVVQRITINDTSACSDEKMDSNPFCKENIDVSNFLDLNSQMNHSDFCLAYIFTYRDFNGGTVGLAWVATPEGSGICDNYHKTLLKDGEVAMRSLNTGIVTFINYNSPIPPKISQLTLTHEIGHNFGAPHDVEESCAPGGDEGNYIMYPKATSGELPNNNKFSRCSIEYITTVLESLVNDKNRFCFEEINDTFCGNKIVEEGEECDCGFDDKECEDQCCYPRESKTPCKLRPNAKCSPSKGPCCTATCQFKSAGALCRAESDCKEESKCNGKSAVCPSSNPKANLTECNQKTSVCLNGECTGSICLKFNMTQCFLTKGHATPHDMCALACQYEGNSSSCRSTFEMGQTVSGIQLLPGSPCDDYRGYCDVLQKCRPVDSDSPLARLKNLFNKDSLLTITQWITVYWWAVVLMGVAFILLMGGFIKCCAVHTPSANPNRPRALTVSESLRRINVRRRNQRESTGELNPNHSAAQRRNPPHPSKAHPDNISTVSNKYNNYSTYDEYRHYAYQREAPDNNRLMEMYQPRY